MHNRAGMTRQRGFTLLELALVISFIAILVVIAIDRMWSLRAEAEKASVMQVIGGLRSALGLQIAKRVVDGGIRSIVALESTNPMSMLSLKPARYVGEVVQEAQSLAQPGDWYFVTAAGYLVYRIQFPEEFHSDIGGPPRLRFKLQLQFDDNNGNGVHDVGEAVYGLDLVAVDPYTWPGFVH